MKHSYLLFLCLLLHAKLFAQQDHFLWVRSQGSPSFELAKSVCTDDQGNVYSAGTFEETVDFDPNSTKFNLTSSGYSDIYILKLDSKGNFIWAKQIGGLRIDHVNSLRLDQFNNLYITGSFENSIDIDPSAGNYSLVSNGSNEGFVASYNSQGQLRWGYALGGPGYDNATDAYPTNDGHVFVCGDFQDSMKVITSGNLFSAGNSDAYFLNLNQDGSFVWAKRVGGKLADYSSKIILDNQNNILIAGKFRDTVDFDPSFLGFHLMINPSPPFSIPAIVDYNTFVLKLDPSGNFIWSIQIDALTSANEVNGIETDIDRHVFIVGTHSGNTDFDPDISSTSILNSPGFAGYLLKLDENGKYNWVKQFKGNGDCAVLGLATDSVFNIYTTGQFSKTIQFNPNSTSDSLTSIGFSTNPFISKLDHDGNFIWVKHLSGGGSGATNIHVDKNATLYTCGGWSDTLNFDPNDRYTLQSAGLFDAFVHKMSQCPGTIFIEKYVSSCDSFVSDNRTYYESGIYSDTVISELLCDTVFNLHLTIHKIEANLDIKHVSCQATNDGAINISGNATQYSIPELHEMNTDGKFENLSAGFYHLEIKDTNGCSITKEINLQQLSCCDAVFVPNAFTPNNDGLNDEFRFLNAFGIDLHSFTIFNRWGEAVFTSQNAFDSWDGHYKGIEMESGSYFYCVRFKCLSTNKEYTLKGDVELIR